MFLRTLIILVIGSICAVGFAESELNKEMSDFQSHLNHQKLGNGPGRVRAIQPASLTIHKPRRIVKIDFSDTDLKPSSTKAKPKKLAKKSTGKKALTKKSAPLKKSKLAGNHPPKKQALAKNDVVAIPQKSATPVTPAPTVMESSAQLPVLEHEQSAGLLHRFTAMGYGTLSTLDGGDRSTVVPAGLNNPIVVSPSGAFLTDINLGLGNFVLESGVQVLQLGSGAGFVLPNMGLPSIVYEESLKFTYIGVPISGKYMFNGERNSSLFAKAGVAPSYLAKVDYNNNGNFLLQEYRYGGFSSFDLLLQASAGFSFRVLESLQVVVEIGGYQGVIPVSNNFSVYNVGGMAGLGIAYLL